MEFLGKWLAGPHLMPPRNFLEALWLVFFRVISGCLWSFIFAWGLLYALEGWGVEYLFVPAAIGGFIAGFFFGLELLDTVRKIIDNK